MKQNQNNGKEPEKDGPVNGKVDQPQGHLGNMDNNEQNSAKDMVSVNSQDNICNMRSHLRSRGSPRVEGQEGSKKDMRPTVMESLDTLVSLHAGSQSDGKEAQVWDLAVSTGVGSGVVHELIRNIQQGLKDLSLALHLLNEEITRRLVQSLDVSTIMPS